MLFDLTTVRIASNNERHRLILFGRLSNFFCRNRPDALFNVATEIIGVLALHGSLHEVDARVTTTVFGFYRSIVSIRFFDAALEFTSVSSVEDDVVNGSDDDLGTTHAK